MMFLGLLWKRKGIVILRIIYEIENETLDKSNVTSLIAKIKIYGCQCIVKNMNLKIGVKSMCIKQFFKIGLIDQNTTSRCNGLIVVKSVFIE